jgi:hypothetical protein
MVTDVFVVLLALLVGGVALTLGLALAVALPGRGTGRRIADAADPDGADPNGAADFDRAAAGDPAYDDLLADDSVDGARLWTAGPADRVIVEAEAAELGAHAEVAAARAERATAAVGAARLRYGEAEEHRAALEAEYDAAQARYTAALRAVQAGRSGPPTPEEQHRAHEVSSAALAAFRRGELSADQLRAVFARAGDWDPEQEAREREAERLAGEEGRVRRAYDAALAAVRVASERLHVAEVAAAATTQEAIDAAVEAQVAADEAGRYQRRRR